MGFVRAICVTLLTMAVAASPAFARSVHRKTTSEHHARSSHARHARAHRSAPHVRKVRGQRSIDSARATQIQDALIQAKYLSGEPTGQWDADTRAAMQKYQADHGWQTRLMPDSRALISLGLGPTQDHVPVPAVATEKPAEQIDPQPNTLASVHSISQ